MQVSTKGVQASASSADVGVAAEMVQHDRRVRMGIHERRQFAKLRVADVGVETQAQPTHGGETFAEARIAHQVARRVHRQGVDLPARIPTIPAHACAVPYPPLANMAAMPLTNSTSPTGEKRGSPCARYIDAHCMNTVPSTLWPLSIAHFDCLGVPQLS